MLCGAFHDRRIDTATHARRDRAELCCHCCSRREWNEQRGDRTVRYRDRAVKDTSMGNGTGNLSCSWKIPVSV